MKRNVFVLIFFLVAGFASNSFGAAYSVDSPDGKIQVVVEDGTRLTFTLKVDGKTILDKCPIGLKSDKKEFGKNAIAQSHELSLADSPTKKVIDVKKAGIVKYNILSLDYKDFNLDVRVCDEAVTCRFLVDRDGKVIVEDETFEIPLLRNNESTITKSTVTKITVGEKHVIVRGIRPEERLWGPYQFPIPFKLEDRIVVSVHVKDDDIKNFAVDTKRWFETRDGGVTWKEVAPSISSQCGLLLQNGDRVFFPQMPSMNLGKYKAVSRHSYTPDYDFSKKAEEGTLPIPDGTSCFNDGTVIKAYKAERLPDSLSKKEWKALRVPAGKTEPVTEMAQLDWPYLTRVVYTGKYYRQTLRAIFPHGRSKIGPDGAIWTSTHSGDGHINPATGQYSPYYSAQILRSEDDAHNFKLYAHMEYEADGKEYPYKSGGFSDNDFEFMPDGSIVWFLRSTWFLYTGKEWDPMYMARSTDNGLTWSKPKEFADTGIYPRVYKLKNNISLLCYARPGMYVTVSENDSGTRWSEPLVLMTPDDRSHLHNKKVDKPLFHEWDGTGGNPEMIPLDDNSALLFYSDFYYPDENDIKRKTILCRKITVERERKQLTAVSDEPMR